MFGLPLFFMLIPLVLFSASNISTSIRKVEENYRSSLIFGMKKIGSVMEMAYRDVDQVSLLALVDPKINHFLKEQFRGEMTYETSVEVEAVYSSLSYLSNTNKYTQSIQIGDINGQSLSDGFFPKSIAAQDWERVERLWGQALWDVDEDAVTASAKKERYIYQSRLLRDYENTTRTAGTIKIYLNTDAFQELFINEETDYTSYFTVDDSGKVRYASIQPNGSAILEEPVPYEQLCTHRNGTFTVQRDSLRLYMAPHVIHENGRMMYSLSIPVDIQTQTRDNLVQLLVLTALCFLSCIVTASIISRRMCRPLEEIIGNMKPLEEEQFPTRAGVRGNDEISLLARQSNRMVQKIQSLIEEVCLVNIRRKELELRALQVQANLYFLYNTLDMTYWTAKVEHAPETSDMIEFLSNFFRQALSGEDGLATIGNGIEYLRYYVVLCQQSKKSFDFDLNVEDSPFGCRVIKSALQSLMENVTIHGIRDTDDGETQADIFTEGDNIIYTTMGNGQGIDVSDIDVLLNRMEGNHRGFGIKNINDRIQLMYGSEHGIHFENVAGGGTKVLVIQSRRGSVLHVEADDCG